MRYEKTYKCPNCGISCNNINKHNNRNRCKRIEFLRAVRKMRHRR